MIFWSKVVASSSTRHFKYQNYYAEEVSFIRCFDSILSVWCIFCKQISNNSLVFGNEPTALSFRKNTKSQLMNSSKYILENEKSANRFLEFSGFIKYDIIFDSRQTVNAREGLVALYPENSVLDQNQNDVNATQSFNMLSIHSRLRGDITGPTLLKAQSSGLIEIDFYGNENKYFSDLNGLRLFNAYMKFSWETTELLIGQYWHPMSVPEYFPSVVSFSAGAPFHPMSRNPQIRVKQKFGALKLISSLLSQRDFTSTGPEGPGSQYLRNSGVPNIHLQMQYDKDSSILSGGMGVDYKILAPELFVTNSIGEIHEAKSSVKSLSWVGFVKAETKFISLTAQGVYAQNAYDVLMIGGYSVKEVINVQTWEKEFSNLNTASVWADVESIGNRIKFGIFSGYTKNLGSRDMIEGPFYGRGIDVGSVLRIAPRIIYTNGPLGISLEGEYTSANYGITNGDGMGGVSDTNSVSNFRSLLSLKYSF